MAKRIATELGKLELNKESGALVLSAKAMKLRKALAAGPRHAFLARCDGLRSLYGLKRLDVYEPTRGTFALLGSVRSGRREDSGDL